ncbi:MAG: hypothetical protein Q4G16_08560 [Cruoricaptor ignavus]|nr:hypothetical protein [Cruoricaptor ignavus]MDO5616227.1 hypothetical protein [Cruoricaptor ignavus]
MRDFFVFILSVHSGSFVVEKSWLKIIAFLILDIFLSLMKTKRMKKLIFLFLIIFLNSCMSSVVNSKKPLTENTIFVKGKYYSVYTKADKEINGRLVFHNSEELVLLEKQKITYTVPKEDILSIKKFSTSKSILFPIAAVGVAVGGFMLVFKGDDGLH